MSARRSRSVKFFLNSKHLLSFASSCLGTKMTLFLCQNQTALEGKTKVITPTVGRIVWFHPGSFSRPFNNILRGDQPMAAIVTYVYISDDRKVNLVVFDHDGTPRPVTSVRLLQDDELPEAGKCYCQWMPYQKAVASGQQAPTLHAEAIVG